MATLKRRAEFLRVRGGRRWSTPAFVIEMRTRSGSDRPMRAEMGAETAGQQREGEGPARFGFTATKKLGNAVVRNRIRRRLREAVRLVAPSQARTGCDYVLIAREAAASRPFAALEKDLVAAFAALHAPTAAGSRPARGDTHAGARSQSTRGRAGRPGPASEG
ncbi:MAG: ribonuclease P protein component [Hyphomicrobium sp.]|nr:ribonuclease P protein component [Hyphomicrobium sp.]